MEFTIRIIIIIVLLLAVTVIIFALIARSGGSSNDIITGIFDFFRDLITGRQPVTPPETETNGGPNDGGTETAGVVVITNDIMNSYT